MFQFSACMIIVICKLIFCVCAILNRYGFNSCGLVDAQQRLKAREGTQEQQSKG